MKIILDIPDDELWKIGANMSHECPSFLGFNRNINFPTCPKIPCSKCWEQALKSAEVEDGR